MVSPRATLAIGFIGFLIYGFPGYMSNDSVVQLLEARAGYYTNPHPPIMAAEWTILDALIAGPVLMLVLQGALFLFGCAALLRRAMSARAAAITAVAVLWFPPVLTTMAVIWKDSQMAAYLIAGAALILSERRRTRVIGVAMVAAGCAFRYNAFGAAVPLVFVLFEWRPGMRWLPRYAISALVTLAMLTTAVMTNRALTMEERTMTPAFVDIAGVLTYTGPRSDAELLDLLRGTPLRVTSGIQARARQQFSVRNPYPVAHGPDRLFDKAANDAELQALNRAWKAMIASDWRAYVAYRIDVFCELLGITENLPWSPVYNVFLENPDQASWTDHNASWSQAQAWLSARLGFLAWETAMFRPYLYVGIALLLLVLMCRDRLTFALLGSGLTYELSFLPTAGTPDFRYSQWMITCTCLAISLLFALRFRHGQRPLRAQRAPAPERTA